ncbi:IS66 family insertion sequence element accessory protein TnpB [Globicatella sulfidifaciens]
MNINQLGQVYLISGKTDMRQGIDSLASLMREKYQLDPFSQNLFLCKRPITEYLNTALEIVHQCGTFVHQMRSCRPLNAKAIIHSVN